MSGVLCFVCNTNLCSGVSDQIREMYQDVIGVNLNTYAQLCHICCHLLNKMYLFKSRCLQRSMEYAFVLSTKASFNLQKSDIEINVLCPDKCNQYNHKRNTNTYIFNYSDDSNDNTVDFNNKCVKLELKEYADNSEYSHTLEQFGYVDEYGQNRQSNTKDYTEVKTENDNLLRDDYNVDSFDLNNRDEGKNNDKSEDVDDISYNYDHEKNELNVYEVKTKLHNDKLTEIDYNTKEYDDNTTDRANSDDVKVKKTKDKGFKRIVLSVEKQKAELEANRKEKKYLEAEFKCYTCAVGFLFKDTYQAHMMRHEESNGEFQCIICTLRFATQASLRIHIASHSERHQCRKCGETLRPCTKRRHACYGPSETQSVACHLCGNLLKHANGLQQHLKRVHASKTGGRRYACNVCGDSYTRQGSLRTHMIKHINRKFHCDQCPGTYSSPYTLNQHKKSHQRNESLHYCDTCGTGFATRKSLLAHIRNTINHQTTTFECPICTRVCPTQKSMASHIQSVHSGTKDYTCDICPARYTNRKSLVRHINTHNNKVEVKMVVCHLCGTNFKGNSKLNRHLREVCKKRKEQSPSLYD